MRMRCDCVDVSGASAVSILWRCTNMFIIIIMSDNFKLMKMKDWTEKQIAL